VSIFSPLFLTVWTFIRVVDYSQVHLVLGDLFPCSTVQCILEPRSFWCIRCAVHSGIL